MTAASPHAASGLSRALTETEMEQRETEKTLQRRFLVNTSNDFNTKIDLLHTAKHHRYLVEKLQAGNTHHLDSSRPWLVYWPMHALDLLKTLPHALKRGDINAENLFTWIFRCWSYIDNDDDDDDDDAENDSTNDHSVASAPRQRVGGFGGGPCQAPMLASCWAACASLVILCSEVPQLRPRLKGQLDTAALSEWLISLRLLDGGFRMFQGGEVDLRASYCAACIVAVFNLDAERIFPIECVGYVGHCQSLDGGVACNVHGAEGHGGYVSCGFKALVLIHALREGQKRQRRRRMNGVSEETVAATMSLAAPIFAPLNFSVRSFVDLDQLRRWCALRQDPCTGGFSGRVNKLVDACYSWWVGGALACIATVEAVELLLQKQQERQKQHQEKREEGETGQQRTLSRVLIMRSLIMAQRCNLFPPALVKQLVRSFNLNLTSTTEPQDGNETSSSAAPLADDDDDALPTTAASWIDDDGYDDGGDFAFHQDRLAQFVLELSQVSGSGGGLCDKPPLKPDLYHSCYALSGLSTAIVSDAQRIAQEIGVAAGSVDEEAAESSSTACDAVSDIVNLATEAYQFQKIAAAASAEPGVKLQGTHPLINLTRDRVLWALQFFGGRDSLL